MGPSIENLHMKPTSLQASSDTLAGALAAVVGKKQAFGGVEV